MTEASWPRIEDIVPHKGAMLLLDRIVGERDGGLCVSATIDPDSPFLVPGFGVPGWAGFEMMAQTVATHDGLEGWRAGEGVKLGFLVACRHYACALEWFAPGDRYEIEARPIMEASETMMWEARMYGAAGEVASAEIMVHQPRDLPAFMAQVRAS